MTRLQIVSSLFVSSCIANVLHQYALPIQGVLRSSYDYVVIGGGPSGLTVANRLTEDASVNVLVIEVGDLDQGEPGVLVPDIEPPQKYRKSYKSVPQAGLNGRSIELPTGQVVGGGSVIGAMVFNRGSAKDYDAWEELGNSGWGWNDLLPYFKKSETYTPANPDIQAEYPCSPDLGPHGLTGPVSSSYPPYDCESVRNFFEGWKSIGVALNPQSNNGLAVGAFHGPLSLTHRNESRCSASGAYYKGIASLRPNLHLLTGNRARKIIFDGQRASGVEFAPINGTDSIETVNVTNEVIVAAGAQKSPQLLLLSGIGNAPLLTQLGIPIVEDLPGVGYNFQDNPSYPFVLNYTNFTLPTPDWLDTQIQYHEQYAKQELALYYGQREGPYTNPFRSGCDVAFLPLPNITSNYTQIIDEARKISLATISPKGADTSVLRGYQAQQKILLRNLASTKTATQETAFDGSIIVFFVGLKPLSRGSISINSTDPDADPVVNFNTYAYPTDLDIMVASFKKNRQFHSSGPMLQLGTVEVTPGSMIQSDEQIRNVLRNGTISWEQPTGTLAMMPRQLGGVVDSSLRVYGLENVRVVDASIMPMIPAGHIMSTVYAVAEKAADLIKEAKTCGEK